MVGTLVHQLTRNLSDSQIKTAGFDTYFVDHTTGVYPQFASGYPWSASTMQVTGDIIADLTEDLAADGAMVEGQHIKVLTEPRTGKLRKAIAGEKFFRPLWLLIFVIILRAPKGILVINNYSLENGLIYSNDSLPNYSFNI